MSYIIEYDRVFLKLDSGYTPLWLSGDSNVYEFVGFTRRERRIRSWSVFMQQVGVSEAKLLDTIQPMLGGKYQEHWKRGSKWVDDAGLVRWIKTGCKHTLTIEELLEANHMRYLECQVLTRDCTVLYETMVATTSEFDAWIEEAKKIRAETPNAWVNIGLKTGGGRAKRPAKEPEEGLVVVKCGSRFIYDWTGDSISFAKDRTKARILSIDDAKKIVRQFPNCRIVSVSVLDAPDNLGVEITDDHGNRFYLAGALSGHSIVQYSPDIRAAKRYSTKAAAERATKTAKLRYSAWDYTVIELPA